MALSNMQLFGKQIDGQKYVSIDALVAQFYKWSFESVDAEDVAAAKVFRLLGDTFAQSQTKATDLP